LNRFLVPNHFTASSARHRVIDQLTLVLAAAKATKKCYSPMCTAPLQKGNHTSVV
jgi:hypothetical protein